jgi:hypothetical protein
VNCSSLIAGTDPHQFTLSRTISSNETGNPRQTAKLQQQVKRSGWTVISMKYDWKVISPFEKQVL